MSFLRFTQKKFLWYQLLNDENRKSPHTKWDKIAKWKGIESVKFKVVTIVDGKKCLALNVR